MLLCLAVLWAAVAASFLRDRIGGATSDSVGSFRNQLRVLQRTTPGYAAAGYFPPAPFAPRAAARPAILDRGTDTRRARTLKRRRDVLGSLLVAMVSTLALGAIPAMRVLWGLHLALDCVLVAYVVMLVRMRNAAAERDMKVSFLPAGASPEAVLALRRSAN